MRREGDLPRNALDSRSSPLQPTVMLRTFLAAVLGGLIVLLGQHYLQPAPPAAVPTHFARKTTYHNRAPRLPAGPDLTAAAERAMPVVVHIRSAAAANELPRDPFSFFFGTAPFELPPREGSGSGVIVRPDGYILTNYHVIEDARTLTVTLSDNRQYPATVVGSHPEADLAVVKIDETGLPTLPLADSERARVGEWVLAVGNPFDLTSTVTAGIISAKGRDIDIIRGRRSIESFLQTDAAVNPGNSGGALVDARGQLLGINTAISSRGGAFEGYSFAIPIGIAARVAEDLIAFGSYRRGYLGLDVADLDSDYAAELGIDYRPGVVVEAVLPGGAAGYAGVLPKDIILGVDGKPTPSGPVIQEVLGGVKVGEQVVLTLLRDGRTVELPVVLKAD